MSWIDRLIQTEDAMVEQAVARERERIATQADEWAAARLPTRGGDALRNFAASLRAGPAGVPACLCGQPISKECKANGCRWDKEKNRG